MNAFWQCYAPLCHYVLRGEEGISDERERENHMQSMLKEKQAPSAKQILTWCKVAVWKNKSTEIWSLLQVYSFSECIVQSHTPIHTLFLTWSK